MRVKHGTKRYYEDPIFAQETVAMEYGPGSQAVGYGNRQGLATLKSWLNEIDLRTGGPLRQSTGPTPKNGKRHDKIYDVGLSCGPSVNAVWAAADPELKARIRDSLFAAWRDARGVYERFATVRVGRDGEREVPALLIDAFFLHERTRNGEVNLHGHWGILEAGVRQDGTGRTGRVGDLRSIMNAYSLAEERFQLSLAWHLQQFAGIETRVVNGKCVMPGVPSKVLEEYQTRKKEAVAWCLANGYDPKVQKHLDAGFYETRGPRTPHDQPAAHRRWKEKIDRLCAGLVQRVKMAPGMKPNAWLKGALDAWNNKPWTAIWASLKSPFLKEPADPQAVRIQSIDVFLYEVSTRPRREARRAAWREMWWRPFGNPHKTAGAGEEAYLGHRRPKVELEKGAKVIVAHTASVTAEQRAKLDKLAANRGWTVEYELSPHQQAQQQKQPGQGQQQSTLMPRQGPTMQQGGP